MVYFFKLNNLKGSAFETGTPDKFLPYQDNDPKHEAYVRGEWVQL